MTTDESITSIPNSHEYGHRNLHKTTCYDHDDQQQWQTKDGFDD